MLRRARTTDTVFYIPVNIYNGPVTEGSECSGQILMCRLNYCRITVFNHLAQHINGTTSAAIDYDFTVIATFVRDLNSFQMDIRVGITRYMYGHDIGSACSGRYRNQRDWDENVVIRQ